MNKTQWVLEQLRSDPQVSAEDLVKRWEYMGHPGKLFTATVYQAKAKLRAKGIDTTPRKRMPPPKRDPNTPKRPYRRRSLPGERAQGPAAEEPATKAVKKRAKRLEDIFERLEREADELVYAAMAAKSPADLVDGLRRLRRRISAELVANEV
jgi:hypothetical protein